MAERQVACMSCQQYDFRSCIVGDIYVPSSLVESDTLPSESFAILLSDLKTQAIAFAMWRNRV